MSPARSSTYVGASTPMARNIPSTMGSYAMPQLNGEAVPPMPIDLNRRLRTPICPAAVTDSTRAIKLRRTHNGNCHPSDAFKPPDGEALECLFLVSEQHGSLLVEWSAWRVVLRVLTGFKQVLLNE